MATNGNMKDPTHRCSCGWEGKPRRRVVYVADSTEGALELTQPQGEALVVLLACDMYAHVSVTTNLLHETVNSNAARALQEMGLARIRPKPPYDYVQFRAECTDRAFLDAVEHTPWLAAKVKAAKALLAQQKAG